MGGNQGNIRPTTHPYFNCTKNHYKPGAPGFVDVEVGQFLTVLRSNFQTNNDKVIFFEIYFMLILSVPGGCGSNMLLICYSFVNVFMLILSVLVKL